MMNMPKFTAEASLGKTKGHYRTSRHPIHVPVQMMSVVYPAMIDLPGGEVITVVDTGPWDFGPDGWVGGGGGGGGANPADSLEAARKARCRRCKANGQDCLKQAILAGDTCAANAATMASAFCHADVGDPSGGITAWGCTVADLLKGNCPQAESPWQNKGYWDYSCGKIGGSYICSGHGVTNCLDSWRLSHPNGTTTGTGTDKFSVTFKGVGGEGSQTFTEQATWNGRTGYGSVCTTLASNLSHKCTGQQNQCQAADHCTAEDL